MPQSHNLPRSGRWRVLPACLTALLLLAGCSDEYKAPAQNNILLFGNGTEPEELDPHIVTGLPESRIISTLLQGLVVLDARTLEPRPGVAESWQISPDGLYYRFSLRKDARWSNGDPVTAQDFLYSWQRVLTPALGSQYVSMLYPVKNARAFHEGTLKDFSKVGVHASWGKHLLEVTLQQPTGYFLTTLAHHSTFPVHPPTIEKHGSSATRGSPWTRPGNFVGNGAFQLTEWKLNRFIRVRRNPHYYDAAKIVEEGLDGVDFLPTDNISTEERMFQTGRLHVSSSLLPQRLHFYRRNHPELLREHSSFGTYYYIFNTTRPPLDDVRVRKALSMTVDRKTLVSTVTQGGEKPAAAFTPPGTPGYRPGTRLHLPFDPENARLLLAAAGFPEGKGFPKLQLLYNNQQQHRKIAEAVQNMWNKHLNVKVELVNQEWKVYLRSVREGSFDIARAGWFGDYLDPNTFLDLLTSYNDNNHSGWHNPHYDQLIEAAKLTPFRQQRMKLLLDAETFLLENMPVLPMYVYSSKRLVRPEVRNWTLNPLDHIVFSELSLAP